MAWIYLSPHFDDVALSCGGLVWEQAQAGEAIHIWTVCAASPPTGNLSPFAQQLHERWQAGQNASGLRRKEDLASCLRLGASSRFLHFLDCIYRRHPHTGVPMYASEASLNGPLHPGDARLVDALQRELNQSVDVNSTLVCPLALGSHVDHQLTRLAAEALQRPLWYYADFPYVLQHQDVLEQMEQAGWQTRVFPISASGLMAWQDSIAAHASQISTFWQDNHAMRQAIEDYLERYGGIRLCRHSTA